MVSETTNNNSIKRRKTDGSSVTSLADFPIGILEHAASFLAAPSRALFAVTLAIDQPSDRLLSIAGSDWDTLDFGEIEKDLATKLSDEDISGILQHIDAVNKVKRLRLTNCTNITGVGLEPLRGSTTIELVDLSLAGDGENPRLLDPDPPISLQTVMPILDSIIAAEGCVLKYLELPYKWRRNISNDSVFHAFIGRYNEMRGNRDTVTCLNCDVDLPEDGLNDWILYGKQNYICYKCTKHYCYECSEDDGDDEPLLSRCDTCLRNYCKECAEVGRCTDCSDVICEHCMYGCNRCYELFCWGCRNLCSYCSLGHCNGCSDGCNENNVHLCGQCTNCLPEEVALLEQSNKKLQEEVEQLKNENSELKRRLQQEVEQLKNEVRGLKLENKELKDKLG